MENEDAIFEDDAPDGAARMTTGTALSALGHVALVGWLVMGWGLEQEPLPFDVTDVSVISGEDYAALVAATSPQPDIFEPAAPEQPQIETPAARTTGR